MDPSATGTRNACPSRRPFIASSTRLVARAAPVLEGMMFSAAARASRRSLDGPSTSACVPVYAWTVVINPFSTPKASSSTFTIGTKQFVVHDAFEITLCRSGSKVSSFTPTTNVPSTSLPGAEMMTIGAPASRCCAALSLLVNRPVDSTTTSTPSSPHGRAVGSRSARILSVLPSTLMPSPTSSTSPSYVPRIVSYFNRWAISSTDSRSLAATKSMSAPRSFAARKKLRPILPNPLMPTLIVMGSSLAREEPMLAIRLESGSGPSASIHVSVHDDDGEAVVPEIPAQGLGHHDRAMMAPGAPDRDREVGLPFGDEAGNGRVQEGSDAFDEGGVRVLCLHVLLDPRVGPGQRAELGDPVRIREEPDVELHVGVPGRPELEAEGHDRDLDPLFRGRIRERLTDPVAELVRREPGRVDHQIRLAAQLAQAVPLLPDALDHPVGRREGVTPPRRLVPVHQVVVRRLQEDDAVVRVQLLQLLQRFGQLAEEHAAPGVDDDRDPGRSPGARGELGHLREQCGREVVHDEVAQVFEAVRRLRAPRAGEAGDDGEPGDGNHFIQFAHAVALRSAVGCACSRSEIAAARSGPIPGVSAISSGVAPRSRASDPNRLSNDFLRAGPTPAMSSSGEWNARFSRV